MELTETQKKILDSREPKIVVMSSAASGKTALLTEKVRSILRAGVEPREIAVITFTNMAATELIQRLGADYKEGIFIGTIHALANYMLRVGGVDTSKVLNEERFDELFELIVDNPHCVKKLEWVLLDEAQDSDSLQFNFLFDMIDPPNFFVVGDVKQCQPAGTIVYLRNGIKKKIEDIQVGDEIIWYENKNGRCCGENGKAYNAIHKYVQQKESHFISNQFLIHINSENNNSSTYTQGHRTFIKMRDNTDYQHVVYLMCDDTNRFRIGKITLFGTKNKNSVPWRAKMTAEKCSKIWLLKIFKTDKEARVYEQKLSYKYQIPQICWQIDKVTWSKEDINYIYEDLDTSQSAKRCLFDHQLSIDYPMMDKNIEWLFNQKFASNATTQIYAINIIPEIMDCLEYDYNKDNHSRKRFAHITGNKEYISEPILVYSLQVDGGTYVADGIVTHNSIYRWKGSEPELLLDLAKREDVTAFTMLENFRNGIKILEFAKRLIKTTGLVDKSVPMRKELGIIEEVTFGESAIISRIESNPEYKNWAILCRTNIEIQTVSNFLKKHNIPFETFKQGDLTKDELVKKMGQDTVKVLTVHSAKGLEWDNVIVIGMKYFSDEERCVCYVAATRARNRLIWMGYETKKKKTKMYRW